MHVAIIMDGNGRWAERRGLKRALGHQAGARAVRRVVEAAAGAPVDVLTLYAFSSDNWSRPAEEVDSLMWLLRRYLQSEAARCVQNGIRVSVIGRRDRLPAGLARIIEQAEAFTAAGKRLTLQLAVDYSARATLASAAPPVADVDLLIRTGGEQRLSDFLLWECAYAELVFIDECWPDFDQAGFTRALAEFRRRQRRFGALPKTVPITRTGDSP